MQIFATESVIRQHKYDVLPYDVDLCFFAHKLVIKIYEDEPIYYDEGIHQIGQKVIENIGFTFIIINPDLEKC